MIREQMCFHFAGESSRDVYHIINVNASQSGEDCYSEPLVLSTSQVHEIINPKISKNYFQYSQKVPISISLDLALTGVDENGHPYIWDEDTLLKVNHWLFDKKYYQPLYFDNYPDLIYECIPVDSQNFTHNGSQGYLTVTFRLQYPYKHSSTQGDNTDYDCSSGSKIISITNSGNTTTFPEFWIHKLGAGAVSIENLTDGGQSLQFYEAQKASGLLTVNGTVYDGQLLDIGNDVYEIDTGDNQVGTHLKTVGGSPVSNIKIPFTAGSAQGILKFNDGFVQDSDTITVGSDTYYFTTSGIYSSNDIPVDISKYVNDASWNYYPADKIYQCVYTLKIQDTEYSFEQGTDADVIKINHGIPVDIDPDILSNYRMINVGLVDEFQKYDDPNDLANGYVNRKIFDNMKPIRIIDDKHLYVPNDITKQGENFYYSDLNQAPYSDTSKQELNFYSREETTVPLIAWENDGCVLFVSDGSISSNVHKGTVLELQSGNIVDATNTTVYTGRTFFAGVKEVQTSLTWQGIKITKIFLMSYGNGTGGANLPKIENDMPIKNDGSSNPADLWYTDSYGNGITYPSDYSFPCNRWETSKTRIANTTITAIINHIITNGNNPNSDKNSLMLLNYDLTNPNTVKCGATVTDTLNNLVKAINASGIAGTDYSQDITSANKYVTAQLMTTGTNAPYVLLTSKIKGANGNNISVKVYNNVSKMYPTYSISFTNGLDCTQDNAIKCLVKAMALNYQVNPNFTADVDRYYPVHLDSNGNVVRLAVNADTDPSSIQIDSASGRNYLTNNVLTVQAMIAGSKGNDIFVASNCPLATWGQLAGELIVSLYGGFDPPASTTSDIYNIMTTIVNTMNANSNGQYTASILNSSQIQITSNVVGTNGNVPISSTCFNIHWNNDTLTGGIDELQDGETVYVNCKEGVEAIESSLPNTYRYDSSNQNYLRLVYGENRLQVTGSCYLRIYWQNRIL